MSVLKILMTKRRDGSIVTRLEREDGTATWQRKDGPNARFFAFHDLEHYAVETSLRYRRGFYGLVLEGWDLADFGSPWPRGPLPADAEPVELVVGLLARERADRESFAAGDFNAHIAQYYAEHHLTGPPSFDDETLERLRAGIRQVHARWDALPAGETLELDFVVAGD